MSAKLRNRKSWLPSCCPATLLCTTFVDTHAAQHHLAQPYSGWPTFLKLTCWGCGTNPSTLEWERARAHYIGEPKSTETELGHVAHEACAMLPETLSRPLLTPTRPPCSQPHRGSPCSSMRQKRRPVPTPKQVPPVRVLHCALLLHGRTGSASPPPRRARRVTRAAQSPAQWPCAPRTSARAAATGRWWRRGRVADAAGCPESWPPAVPAPSAAGPRRRPRAAAPGLLVGPGSCPRRGRWLRGCVALGREEGGGCGTWHRC